MITTDFLISLEESLSKRCSTIAEAWFQALEPILIESNTAVSLQQLHTLTEQLLFLIIKSPLDIAAIQSVGSAVARQCGTQPAVLSATQQLLAQQLTAGLSHQLIIGLQQHLQTVLSELAAGFLQAAQATRQTISQPIEDVLHRSDTWFQSIVTTASDGILTIDSRHRICFANPAVETMFGYPISELIGKNLDILLPERFQAVHNRHVQYFGETGITIRTMQQQTIVYGRHASGREFPIEAAISQVNPADQKYYTAILRDATERKRTEAALQRTQKLESLGTVAGGIAHDFNNLLIALIAESEAALLKMLHNQPVQQNIRRIIQVSERGIELTHQLMAYSDKGQFQIVSCDFNKLIADNRELLEAMLPKNITLKMNLEADLPPIEADARQIQQVIVNLVINAAEAYQGWAGTVEIETELKIIDPDGFWEEANQQLQPGKYICLRVCDQGHGMDEETVAHIFDPFFTTKVSSRGLGLAVIQSIIRNHRGAIHVTSQAGQGSTFQVLFPVTDTSLLIEDALAQKSQVRPDQILFIDDEEIVRGAITEILELSGFTVLQAENGHAGLTLFKQHENEISLILLDKTMPIMSGDEVLAALRQTHPNLPVLMLSGYDTTGDFKQTIATRFLPKPFKMDTLLTYIHEMLN